MLGYFFWRIMRLDTPFRLLTRLRDGHLRVVVHEKMDMVVFAVELYQFRFKVITDPGEDTS
jgi:hypothetical protein